MITGLAQRERRDAALGERVRVAREGLGLHLAPGQSVGHGGGVEQRCDPIEPGAPVAAGDRRHVDDAAALDQPRGERPGDVTQAQEVHRHHPHRIGRPGHAGHIGQPVQAGRQRCRGGGDGLRITEIAAQKGLSGQRCGRFGHIEVEHLMAGMHQTLDQRGSHPGRTAGDDDVAHVRSPRLRVRITSADARRHCRRRESRSSRGAHPSDACRRHS